MRVAYVVGWPEGPSSGPFKKIRSQTAVWAEQGVDVALFVLTVDEHAGDWRALPAAHVVTTRSAGLGIVRQKEALIAAARRWRPEVIYHRWSLPYPGLVRAAGAEKVILEINTDDIVEYDQMRPPKGLVNRATRGLVLSRAAGLAFVTHELSQSPAFARFGRPSVVVANGISLADVPLTRAPANERPRLLFIGQPGAVWHGTDKLLALARQRSGWDFDIVGPSAADLPMVPGNVTVHGTQSAAGYARLLAEADIGVGTLALHRNRMREASPLKVREYLAAGLPTIVGYVDTDFPSGAEFLLTLDNVEGNVDEGAERIAAFVTRWKGSRVSRDHVLHLDHGAKESARIAFFREVAGRAPPD